MMMTDLHEHSIHNIPDNYENSYKNVCKGTKKNEAVKILSFGFTPNTYIDDLK